MITLFFYHNNSPEEAITDTIIIEASTPWLNDRVRVEKEFDINDDAGLKTTKIGDEIFK